MHVSVQVPAAVGGELTWTFCEPSKLLAAVIAKNRNMHDIFLAAARRRPPLKERPWRLVIGFDEFVPGFVVTRLVFLVRVSIGFDEFVPGFVVAWLVL